MFFRIKLNFLNENIWACVKVPRPPEILDCGGEWRNLTISKFTLPYKWCWRTNQWPTLSGLLRWKDERLNRLWRWQHTENNCCFSCVVVWYVRDKHRTNILVPKHVGLAFWYEVWYVICIIAFQLVHFNNMGQNTW
jgi:hypothetical protein